MALEVVHMSDAPGSLVSFCRKPGPVVEPPQAAQVTCPKCARSSALRPYLTQAPPQAPDLGPVLAEERARREREEG